MDFTYEVGTSWQLQGALTERLEVMHGRGVQRVGKACFSVALGKLSAWPCMRRGMCHVTRLALEGWFATKLGAAMVDVQLGKRG